MPLALDDTTGGAGAAAQGGFDLQTANTLFWKPVPLLLRQADREDQNDELTFRILTGALRSNHNMRVLRIHISSETDLFFLHSLEVSEEDFQSLKNEQGILVDFASFPVKIITLLDKCTTVQPVDAPRFQAVLTVRGTESIFRIVETNDFKQLPHITLAFRPGNDAAIKQFLAFRLLEVKVDVEELTGQLNRSQSEHSAASSDLGAVKQQLAQVREQYDKHLLEVQAESKTQRATAHEERARERAELKDAHEREVSELSRRQQEALSQVNARLAELDTENRKLRETKYELDTRVSELSHRLGSAEGANRSLEDDVQRLRALSAGLGTEKAERDVTLNDLRARLGAAEEKAASQSEVIESQRSRIRDLESGVRGVEARCGELKDALAAEGNRVREAQQEVVKGNNVIEKLASDLRLSKEKVKRKQSILVRQEEELTVREQQMAAAAKEMHAAQQQLDALKAEVSGLRQENSELRSKLEDSKHQLQSNEQMIRWLNQQVTEAQLGTATGGGMPGSRYSSAYRPALPAPTPSVHTSATPAAALMPAPPPQTYAHGAAVVATTPALGGSTALKYSSSFGGLPSAKSYLPQAVNSPARVTPGAPPVGSGAGQGYGSTMSSSGPLRFNTSGSGQQEYDSQRDFMTPGVLPGGAPLNTGTQPASRFFSR